MSSSLRNYYLTVMGVDEWKLRPNLCVANFFYYQLSNPENKMVGYLMAESNARNEMDLVKEEKLLKGILKSLSSSYVIEKYEFQSNTTLSKQIDFVIVMGKRVIENSFSKTLMLNNLFEILSNPLLKKDIWKQLQTLIRR